MSVLDRIKAFFSGGSEPVDPAARAEAERLADERDNLRLSQSQSETTFVGTNVPGTGADKPDRQ